MNQIEALQALVEHKKIRMKRWGEEAYLAFDSDGKLVSDSGYEEDLSDYLNIYSLKSITDDVWEIYEEPEAKLTDKEKEYLENFLRPFKNKVISIQKLYKDEPDCQYLYIILDSSVGVETITMPLFPDGIMYKGMFEETKYSIYGLGLFKGK